MSAESEKAIAEAATKKQPKAIEIQKAVTLDELIVQLQAKRANGLFGTTKVQYIIMAEGGQLITMHLMRAVAKAIITTLKVMLKGD